ncbi:ribonuclease HII [Chlamydiota bacterium]
MGPEIWKALPKSERARLKRLTLLESQARLNGYRCVAGVDEAGRGPLAGPVFAAACAIPAGIFFPGINDSKLLSAPKRQALFELITTHPAVAYGISSVDHETIDRINIHQASLEAMRGAVAALAGKLKEKPDYVLVDGVNLTLSGIVTERVIHGDHLSQMIAAASIVAKQTRDQLMTQFHSQYPEYGFDEHKGYGTPRHMAALEKYGPCPIHRRSFAPVSQTLIPH